MITRRVKTIRSGKDRGHKGSQKGKSGAECEIARGPVLPGAKRKAGAGEMPLLSRQYLWSRLPFSFFSMPAGAYVHQEIFFRILWPKNPPGAGSRVRIFAGLIVLFGSGYVHQKGPRGSGRDRACPGHGPGNSEKTVLCGQSHRDKRIIPARRTYHVR